MCILKNYQSKVRGHIRPSHSYNFLRVWWELLKSTFSNFRMYNTVLTVVLILYIISSELGRNWKLVPFNYLHPSSPSPDFFSFINCVNSCEWGVFNLLFHVFLEYINEDIAYLRCEYLKITQKIDSSYLKFSFNLRWVCLTPLIVTLSIQIFYMLD